MFWVVNGVYLVVAVLFILGLKAMSSPKTARGHRLGRARHGAGHRRDVLHRR
jgi:NAD/NADP transhydrogenase beta subunit